MSGFGELHLQCARRGWKLSLDGSYPDGKRNPGLIVNALDVRDRNGELLATVAAGATCLDEAAVDAARTLEQRGLIA